MCFPKMADLFSLRGFSLTKGGAPRDYSLLNGRSVAIVGPSGSGKTLLLECLQGKSSPRMGSVHLNASIGLAKLPSGIRLKPQGIAQRGPGAESAAAASEALTAAGLWEVRQTLIDKLSPGQRKACELLEPLAGKAQLLVFDGHLDSLDPWALPGTVALIRKRLAGGGGLVVATSRPEIAQECDDIIVLRGSEIRYAGSREELIRREPVEIIVETSRAEAIEALVSPFVLSARKTETGLLLRAEEGQELAARLLLEGYGSIRAAIVKAPTLVDILLRL